MMEALCDECGRVFAVAPQARRDGEIETTFFICAHCGHEYIVCRTDAELRALSKRVERQRRGNRERRARGRLSARRMREFARKFEISIEEFKAKLDALNRTE